MNAGKARVSNEPRVNTRFAEGMDLELELVSTKPLRSSIFRLRLRNK